MLCDYIYADLAKAASLYSQLTGGIVELRESTAEKAGLSDNKRHYDFKVFKHDAGGSSEERSAEKEVRKPHHALFVELEDALSRNGYLVDLTRSGASLKEPEIRESLRAALCLKVRGRAVIEDYARLKEIAVAFPEIAKLINRSARSNIESSPEYAVLLQRIASAEEKVRGADNREVRARAKSELDGAKRKMRSLVEESSEKVGAVEPWILEGLQTWINTYLSTIVNLRIYPSLERQDEHVFGHLKKEWLEDNDSASLHFTYGSFPSEELTIVGVVTSVPESAGEQFDPLAEFAKEASTPHESVERAFRGMFRGFDGFEQVIRTCRYPRVLVQPLVVYRGVEPKAP
jgi:hypothetical protein